jgi:hypothetical protein
MNTFLIAIMAVCITLIMTQIYPRMIEGFQSQTPMEKAKQLLSYMEFEGTGDNMILRINTPGGLRVENGGVTINNTDDTTSFAKNAGGLLFNQTKITEPLASLPKGTSSVGTTWAISTDLNGICSASATSKNPVYEDGGYLPIIGFERNNKNGTYVVPSM